MKQQINRLIVLAIFMVIGLGSVHAADVVSENLVFVKEDGRSYLLQRTMRTGWEKYDFHVDKNIVLDDFFHIDPNVYEWDDANDENVNTLKFNSGTYTVMYPGNYGDRVSIDEEGVYTLQTWDGKKREDGRFGIWNSPGNFSRFVQAWVFPDNFRILSYESNREGEWIERNNTLAFFSDDVNDLSFIVRFQQLDTDGDGIADIADRCPETPAGVVVDETGCEPDYDGDGVVDSQDQCPETPADAVVDTVGCERDDDADGVPNRMDQCADTPEKAEVDARGCELDADQDGVVDRLDKCPETTPGASVDRDGCEQDCDGDGVVNSRDECPRTPEGAKVDEQGCETDSDGDGVVDSRDQCPDTPAGAAVDERGCERDSDGDGVVDSQDQCPDTPAGAAVDERGCELDSDGDGVVNQRDLCPDTAPGSSVDETGCVKAQPITLRGVNFHFNSDQLTDESMLILDDVATTLLSHPELRLEVAGHTDSEGDDAYNLDLSQRRAESVRTYLVSRGIDPDKLSARGYGEQRPVGTNNSADGRAANRRVELIRLDR